MPVNLRLVGSTQTKLPDTRLRMNFRGLIAKYGDPMAQIAINSLNDILIPCHRYRNLVTISGEL